MLVDALPIPESQPSCNLSASRRQSLGLQELLDKSQYFQLFGTEGGHGHEKYQTDVWYRVYEPPQL